MPKKASPVKMCLAPSCHKVLPLTEFYSNRAWDEQNGVDIYCKECAKKMCTSKEALRKYCWENSRVFSEGAWGAAEKKAMRILANNKDWLSKSTSQKRKDEIKEETICAQYLGVMNLALYYAFHDTTDEEGNIRNFDPGSMNGVAVQTDGGNEVFDEGAKYYNATWNGMYTKREIEYLDNYYQRLEDEFVLEDINIQDYARKVAKASLEADTRYDNMRSGRCSSKEWQEAQSIFDSMSKSAAFAACQKKDKNAGADMILCEIIQEIEMNHYARKPKVTFEPDDIDLILADFAHTDIAIK